MGHKLFQEEASPRAFFAGAGKLFLALLALMVVQQGAFGMPEELEPWHGFLAAGAVVGFWSLAGATRGWYRRAAGTPTVATHRVSRNAGVVGMTLANLEGRVLTSNRMFQEMLGYSEEEICGRVFTEFSPATEKSEGLKRFHNLIEGKCDRYEIDKPYCRKDGRVIWGHLTVSCVRDAQGDPQFAVALLEPFSDHGGRGDAKGSGTSLMARS